jgi:homopolymeric O-antigen transport system ATP-binding protein
MLSEDIAIRVRNVAKHYLIYARPEDRLKQSIVPRLQRLIGRSQTRYFHDYAALSGVSFEARRGETIGLIGRNGSGKSTMLRLLHGTLAPTSGTIETKGRILALQLGTGFNPDFTGRENLRLCALVTGLSPTLLCERVDSIIDFAGIGDFMDQPVKFYSSGMYSRLAFAVAAHLEADILLVDEVLAVGDLAFTQKCMRFINSFKARGTLVLCTHDLSAITSLCDRALWMDAGAVRMIGSPKEVCAEYQRMIMVEGDSSAKLKFGGRRIASRAKETPPGPDHRAETLAGSRLHNEIELFEFDQEAPWFGQRLASIKSLVIKDQKGTRLTRLAGGEEVTLEVRAVVHSDIDRPIIGFSVLNKQGQNIFGDNTYLSYRDTPVAAKAGSTVSGRFTFVMPYLPTGDYSILCAIANGTQEDNVQQHWIDEALLFHVSSSHVVRGLCGIPMHAIELDVNSAHSTSA